MNELIAKYEIYDTFKITGRGIIFAGVILEGEFLTGDLIKFNFNGNVVERKIKGIESVKKFRESNPNVGIMIECLNEQEIDDLRNWSPNLTVGEIYSNKE